MSNRQRFQQQEVGAYAHNGHAAQQIYQHHPYHPEHAMSGRHNNPQQFGLERNSAHSILRRSPALSSSFGSFPGAASHGNAARSPTRRQPLVLDASSSSSAAAATPSSAPPSSTSQNFLRNIWKDRRPASPHPSRRLPQQHLYPSATHYYGASSLSSSDSVQSSHQPQHHLPSSDLYAVAAQEQSCAVAASVIARDPASAHAGFLQKLGQNVPVWKRRFFVLEKPRASLYYFLSPNDTSPRGCLDLEGAQVYVPSDEGEGDREAGAGERSSGPASSEKSQTWRMELFWPDTNKCIQLEAKSQEARDAWLEALQANQYGCVQNSLQQAQHNLSACTSRIGELEREVKNYKLVEQELQASQLEAKAYRAKFEELDEALRMLQAHMRRAADEESTQAARSQQPHSADKQTFPSSPSVPALVGGSEEHAARDDDCQESGDPVSTASATPARDTSLLDASVEDDLDIWNVPGAHFSGLYNVCEQLKQTVRLSQAEASQAVADCGEAQAKVEAIEKRMAKAEKHLCKLWEENCGLRKTLKQRKRERQVLVREVKTLREDAIAPSAERRNSGTSTAAASEPRPLDDDEEQLLNELEAHVITSIRLHEQLLGSPLKGAGTGIETPAASKTLEDNTDLHDKRGQDCPASTDSRSASVATTASATSASAVTSNPAAYKATQRPVASLLDDQSESYDDDLSSAQSISSINVEAESVREPRDLEDHHDLKDGRPKAAFTTSSMASTPERPNPILQLDEESVSTQDNEFRTSASETVCARRGEATSQLHCPFADVIETKHRSTDVNNALRRTDDELHVYHLTFYSRKIGLQFQKVPPPPEKKTGLLTDALAADLRGTSNSGGNKTASELRRIAAISNRAKSDGDSHSKDEACQVAKPIDAVIVCGFDGFDDSGTNVRPSLGARLVAFDGVSVEVGKWTFDSIRKSIQARSRPLTLSFRNEYLTTEQRAILTKALANVESTRPVSRRPPSVDPSDHSALSHESSTFVNGVATRPMHDDEMSGVSVRSGSSVGDHPFRSPFPRSFSGARSVSSSTARDRQNAFRSFSDAGSSTSMISSVAPLVTSLLYRNSKDPFTPDYLLRKPEPVENTPQHQDFQSELL